MKLEPSKQVPWWREDILSGDRRALLDYMRKLVTWLMDTYEAIARTVNYNESHVVMPSVKQTAKPTPNPGEIVLWNDTDAPSGSSTHYLVVNDGGTVITFASVEKAP